MFRPLSAEEAGTQFFRFLTRRENAVSRFWPFEDSDTNKYETESSIDIDIDCWYFLIFNRPNHTPSCDLLIETPEFGCKSLNVLYFSGLSVILQCKVHLF